MLESDYFALKHNVEKINGQENEITTEILKEIIIPALQQEVNYGKNFALLRQIYNCMILATWFKRNLKESILGQVYVGKNKISGVDVQDRSIKEKIYKQYIKSFKKGVYNYVKEEYEPSTQQIIPRKYFSGGMEMIFDVDNAMVTTKDKKTVQKFLKEPMVIASANLVPDSEDFSMVTDGIVQGPQGNVAVKRAKDFANRLSEIYQFSKKPVFR